MWARAMWLLLAAELVATVLDLNLGPWGPRVHWEERFNARAGVQVACGHIDALWSLQYRTFCGGCSAEAVMAAPLFRLFEPTVRVWKLVPVAFHLGIVGLGTYVARRAVDERGAVAWLVLAIGAPGFYRDLALTGWGNHAESTLFPLLAVALLLAGKGRLHVQLLAGAVTGLGLWFCHTSAHALGAVAVAAVLTGRWRSLACGLALPAGLTPWWLYHRERAMATDWTQDWAGMVDPAPAGELWRWLSGPFMRDGLWPTHITEVAGRISTHYPDMGWLPSGWWGLSWVLALLGAVLSLMAVRNRQAPSPAALLFGPLALAGLLLAYGLRHDLWGQTPEDLTFASFNLRYRSPLVPMLALSAVSLTAWRRGRWLAWPALLSLAIFGLGMRMSQWDQLRLSHAGLQVYAPDTRPDQTVPTGMPPQRRVQAQGRPQDVRAALDFLEDHEDPFQECRADHLLEVGRRIGIGSEEPEVLALTHDAMGVVRAPQELRWLAEGIARTLIDEDGTDRGLAKSLPQLEPELAVAVAHAAGRRAYSAEHSHPGLKAGACERRAELAVSDATRGGERRPVDLSLDPTCDAEAWWPGIGSGWARFVGCSDSTEAPPEAAQPRWQAECAIWRHP